MADYSFDLDKVRSLERHLVEGNAIKLCTGSLRLTLQWVSRNVAIESRLDVLDRLHELGGECDCEVLINAIYALEQGLLKANDK